MRRIAFLGPEGTHSHDALLGAPAARDAQLLALGSNRDVVVAVQDGRADRALAPLENSVEGGVNATLDALTFDAPDIAIVGELVHAVHHCLIAAAGTRADQLGVVLSHPQGLAQCAEALRRLAPSARAEAVASTAVAVQRAAVEPGVGAIASRGAAERYGASVLAADIEDRPGNATRFVWLAPASAAPDGPPTKSSLVFHGAGDASPGWLVRCLSEFAFRGVNLTRIESRPLRSQLGHYLFHVDLDGAPSRPAVAEAIAALGAHCEDVRLLGAYPAAPASGPVATLPSGHEGYPTS